jgi:hypothetical protein
MRNSDNEIMEEGKDEEFFLGDNEDKLTIPISDHTPFQISDYVGEREECDSCKD